MQEGPSSSDRDLAAVMDLEGLRSLFDDSDVRYAVLFGSYARGTESPASDLDLCLRFADECSRRDRFRQRNRLDAAIQSYADRFVDVANLEGLPETIALNAIQEGILVYGDADAKAADEQHLAQRVAEASDRRARRRREFIDRLAEGDV